MLDLMSARYCEELGLKIELLLLVLAVRLTSYLDLRGSVRFGHAGGMSRVVVVFYLLPVEGVSFPLPLSLDPPPHMHTLSISVPLVGFKVVLLTFFLTKLLKATKGTAHGIP